MDSVLLAVCGLSPQIVTETLYALHREGRFPSRAILLTTRQGETLVREKLLCFLLGSPVRLTVLVPGSSVEEVAITEVGMEARNEAV